MHTINKKINLILLSNIILLFSCNSESVENAAKDYCSCMDSKITISSEIVAMKICEAELVSKYHYYRLEKITLPMEENAAFEVSKEESEKARYFIMKLDSLVYRNCNRNMR
jgi:hypothetical protein